MPRRGVRACGEQAEQHQRMFGATQEVEPDPWWRAIQNRLTTDNSGSTRESSVFLIGRLGSVPPI